MTTTDLVKHLIAFRTFYLRRLKSKTVQEMDGYWEIHTLAAFVYRGSYEKVWGFNIEEDDRDG